MTEATLTRKQVQVIFMIGDINKRNIPLVFQPFEQHFEYAAEQDVTIELKAADIHVRITAMNVEPLARLAHDWAQNREWMPHIKDPIQRMQIALHLIIQQPDNSLMEAITILQPHLIVMGQTPPLEAIAEEFVRRRNITHNFLPLVMRFSSFYGQKSVYSGKSAVNAGYYLDMEKSLFLLEEFMYFDPFIRALYDENYAAYHSALFQFNAYHNPRLPILYPDPI